MGDVVDALAQLLVEPRTTVVNRRHDRFDIYIGRPSIWGNPFSHRSDTLASYRVVTLAEALAQYEVWIKLQRPDLLVRLPELRGKVLGCWCKPGPCHGDILARLADNGPLSRTGARDTMPACRSPSSRA